MSIFDLIDIEETTGEYDEYNVILTTTKEFRDRSLDLRMR